MDGNSDEESEDRTLGHVACVFRDILEDVQELGSNVDWIGDILSGKRRRGSEVDGDVALLKDDIAFLAKSVLALRDAHEETKAQLGTLLEYQVSSSPLSPNDRKEPGKTLSPAESKTDPQHASEDSPDSGITCSSSSSGTDQSSAFHSRHDLHLHVVTDNADHNDAERVGANSPMGETSLSQSTTTTTTLTLPASDCTASVLRSLISADVAFTGQLRIVCQALETEKPQSRCRTQLEDLFCRHTLFLQLLTSLRSSWRSGLAIGLEQIVNQLLRFWSSNQKCVETYMSLLMTDSSAPSASTISAILRNHVSFLHSYLTGVNDSLSRSDGISHLAHVISLLDYVLRFSLVSIQSPLPHSRPNEAKGKTVNHNHTASQTEEPDQFFVSFIEGASRITGTYRIADSCINNFPVTTVQISPGPGELVFAYEIMMERYFDLEQEHRAQGQAATISRLRKTSWKSNLVEFVKHALQLVPRDSKRTYD